MRGSYEGRYGDVGEGDESIAARRGSNVRSRRCTTAGRGMLEMSFVSETGVLHVRPIQRIQPVLDYSGNVACTDVVRGTGAV